MTTTLSLVLDNSFFQLRITQLTLSALGMAALGLPPVEHGMALIWVCYRGLTHGRSRRNDRLTRDKLYLQDQLEVINLSIQRVA